jgi:hypothetical protein
MALVREHEFVIGCLSGVGGDHGASEPSSPEWPNVLEFARRNGAAPALFAALRERGGLERVPPTSRLELSRLYHRTGILNALMFDELERLSRSFQTAGVPLIALKGSAIIAEWAHDLAVRPMEDLDLLVREQDLKTVDGILSADGYVPDESSYSRDWYYRHHHHIAPLYHPGKRITVEVHRNILYARSPFHIDAQKLWERSRPVRLGEGVIRVLSTEDTLLHLCLHLSYAHCFHDPLKTLLDIRRIVVRSGDRIDWWWMVREAEKRGCADYVFPVLRLAKEVLGAEIPIADLTGKRHGPRPGLASRLVYDGLVRRYAFSSDESDSVFPRWVLDILFRELPRPGPFRKKAGSILDQVLSLPDPDERGTDREQDPPRERSGWVSVLRWIGKAVARTADRRRRPVWNPR